MPVYNNSFRSQIFVLEKYILNLSFTYNELSLTTLLY